MQCTGTSIHGVYHLKPKVYSDKRGFFLESYSLQQFAHYGITTNFVQDNHSFSVQNGVIRGLHFQYPPFAQTKLIRVIQGAVYDVVLDLRKSSPSFGKWESFELSDKTHEMIYIPKGCAHGFCTLQENTGFLYKCDTYYHPYAEGGILWNDPDLCIPWPCTDPLLSPKDEQLPRTKEFSTPFL